MSEESIDNLPRRDPPHTRLIIAQCVLVAALAVWLLVLQRPIGQPDEWIIDVLGPVYPLSYLLPGVLTLVGFGGLIAYLWRSMRREKIDTHRRALEWTIVLGLVVGAWSLQMALWSVTPGSVALLSAVQLSGCPTGPNT